MIRFGLFIGIFPYNKTNLRVTPFQHSHRFTYPIKEIRFCFKAVLSGDHFSLFVPPKGLGRTFLSVRFFCALDMLLKLEV